ncbi:MAG: RNA-binding S4 domain-containing protein [Clostridia bacterium]|nr:RNA-binding S4 domain-containing protein [Clostridia bacterium]
MRLDKYLKVSRIIKRRTVANEVCSLGRVSINGKEAKPSSEVREGDVLSVLMGGRYTNVKVLSVRETASKNDAASMYELLGENNL